MIYWDNNATTPLAPEVLDAMLPYFKEQYYNPSAAYSAAKRVHKAIEAARESVAALIGAHADEIVFTSGGTEASNTALRQFDKTLMGAIEHPASLQAAEVQSCDIAPVDAQARIDASAWQQMLAGHDGVSFALANHEIGVIQDMELLAGMARDAGARVHVDMVQAAGKIPIKVQDVPVHFASLSAHKLHGPKGIGALFVRRGTSWKPLVRGGMQESSRRAGTENVAGIIGFGKAAELALAAPEHYRQLAQLRDLFESGLRAAGLDIVVHGEGATRMPHVSNLRIKDCSAESITLLLEPMGLICASGSACTSSDPKASHVLLAMGLDDATARGALRFSMNRMTDAAEVAAATNIIVKVVERVKAAQSLLTGPVMVYKP